MATSKGATIYIVDVGKDMGEKHNGRKESDLEYGMRYIWDKVASIMSSNRTTLMVGVTGLRTNQSQNPLYDDKDLDGYENICVWKTLGAMNMNDVRHIQPKIKPSTTYGGDVLSAIIVAIQEVTEATKLKSGKPGKYDRKIVLLTNGRGSIDPDGINEHLDEIAKKINGIDINLTIIGVDFDDPEYGFKEEEKDLVKGENESILRQLVQQCSNGLIGTLDEAINSLAIPDIKNTKPYATYTGKLTLGDPKQYPETTLEIDVQRLFKTKTAKAPSASRFVTAMLMNDSNGHSSHTVDGDVPMLDAPTGNDLAPVRNARAYKVNDPSAPGGKREVEREELSKGYEYGRTAVAISASEENVTKLETLASFSIIGFVPRTKYERYLNMGESCITIAQKTSDEARLALSSLIHALFELDSYAVARIVVKDGKDPQIVLLAPSIEPDLEALIDVPLPFAEDVRPYRFPPLDRVVTSTGNVLKSHRNLPSDDLTQAMSNYVDSMDLSAAGKDDEGRAAEYMPIEDTYSPLVHRINQAIRRRAIKPDAPVEPPANILLQWCHPPPDILKASESQLNKLVAAADVKKVPAKVKGKRYRKDAVKPLSGLDVDALLGGAKRQKISAENAIPEFKQVIDNAESDSALTSAATQMTSIIRTLVTKSFGDNQYEQAAENMRVLREAMIEMEIPEVYNDFMRDLKRSVIKGELGGERADFWYSSVRRNKLGLIDTGASPSADVSEADAKAFYQLKHP